ncbi:MAG TPA: SRPBCC family protein [Mycobacterium sp.]|nr:SRPBCC family protein [Mycobacterium sp.]
MELVNEFRVPVPIAQAWGVLTDVERIAPCIPGAELLSVDGDDFTGKVKVKVGPISVAYQGNGTFLEKDAGAHRAVIKGTAKETRGQGNAAAVITLELKDEGETTGCVITTDLTISGKAAQFGRGVLADVSGRLIGQFAQRLEADLRGGATAAPTAAGAPQEAFTAQPAADAGADLNLLSVVAAPLAKRAAPVAAGLLVGLLLGWLFGGRRASGPQYVLVERVLDAPGAR